MADEKKCSQCKNWLPANALDGLCPQCLMQMAMKSDTRHSDQSIALRTEGAIERQGYGTSAQLDITVSRSGSESAVKKQDRQPGSQIGSFTLNRKLGEGGMGTVYEAFDAKTDRRVALKVLKHTLNTPEARKRFLREGRTAASINHPNSVYVYGTDKINGKLVISMELVGGGNLQRIIKKDGPMHYRQAVDAILQVIDGLEAAERVGILHRDVKPANCFVDLDGTVKVGDFGLSISTLGTEESLITRENAMLGTPAFSSPEQLRGDDLDLRSDIYSVGVTLFYLLTGNVPFEAENMVQLLAAVLELPAPSAHSLNAEIPRDLSTVIDRCLAKNAESRWKNYAVLREALQSHSSEAPVPAPIANRLAAGIIDGLVTHAVGIGIGYTFATTLNATRSGSVLLSFLGIAAPILYFTISEGWKGKSVGKALMDLCVIDLDQRRPSFRRTFLRSAIRVLFPISLVVTFTVVMPLEDPTGPMAILLGLSSFALFAVLFSTARQSNGYAGLHELASGTRVVEQRHAATIVDSLKTKNEMLQPANDAESIGPYDVLGLIGNSEGAEVILGYDSRLLRRVWIRKYASTPDKPVPELTSSQRTANRPSRLRWLNSQRSRGSSWDVFEAVDGQSLMTVVTNPKTQSWAVIRVWLLDLASELAAGLQKDGSLPSDVSLRNIWITAGGRVRLLDFAAPERESQPKPKEAASKFDLQTAQGSQDFLKHVADRIQESQPRPAQLACPLHASDFLDRLEVRRPMSAIAAELRSMMNRNTTVSKIRKWGMLATALAFPTLMFCGLLFGRGLFEFARTRNPAFQLSMDLSVIENLERQAKSSTPSIDPKYFKVFISNHFGEFIRDKDRWTHKNVMATFAPHPGDYRYRIEQIVDNWQTSSDEDVARARELLAGRLMFLPRGKEITTKTNLASVGNELACLLSQLDQQQYDPHEQARLAKINFASEYAAIVGSQQLWDSHVYRATLARRQRERAEQLVAEYSDASNEDITASALPNRNFFDNPMLGDPRFALGMAAYTVVLCGGIPAIFAGLLFRGGIIMLLFQVACVTRNGKRAGRLRMFWRAILWTLPAVGVAGGAISLSMATHFTEAVPSGMLATCLVITSVSLLIPIFSMLPKRSLVDMLSGTYLVPR